MATKMKRCSRHNGKKGKELPVTEFPHDRREKDGFSVWCKTCWKEYQESRKAKSAGPKKVGAKVALKTKAAKPAKAVKSAKKSATKVKENSSPKASQQVSSKSQAPAEEIPAGLAVRDLNSISELPSQYMLMEWKGMGKVQENFNAYKEKYGHAPSIMFRFNTSHYFETNIPAGG
jgi:hypothetical protein